MDIPGYKIDRKIGQGGMATVYLATQISLERPVVLKILDVSRGMESEGQIERFLSEGRIVASLNHPNIITIYDIGIADDNSLYISMEYIKGGDLKARIGIPMDPREALGYLVQITRGLKLAHEHGIIHRDVKPANILFRDDNTPLLTDFGIAKRVDSDMSLTSTGIFLGSPNYVSPEQATGGDIDGRSDIYSLGCIFYEMLSGEKPFKAETVFDVVMQHKSAPIPRLPEDLAKYQPLLEQMMAKTPRERFANTGTLLTELENLFTGSANRQLSVDYDFSGMGSGKKKTPFSINRILLVALGVSALFFFSLQFVEIRLKSDAVDLSSVSVRSSLNGGLRNGGNTDDIAASTAESATGPVSEDVINALVWLGEKSLDEYRLTHPPQDNAHYYFSRLLNINPDSAVAQRGMMEIAERYALLAEEALVNNNHDKTAAYINIGLKINPENQTLLRLKKLNEETRSRTFTETVRNFFSGLFS